MAAASSALFRTDDVLLDTCSNIALFRDVPWFDNAPAGATSIDLTGLYGTSSRALARGTATVSVMDELGRRRNIKFANAYHDPTAPCNLVGLTSLQAAGLLRAELQPTGAFRWTFRDSAEPSQYGTTFAITTTPSAATNQLHVLTRAYGAAAFVACTPLSLREAHEALNHVSVHRLRSIAATADGFKLARHTQAELNAFQCIACSLGKQPRAVMPTGPHEPVATAHGVHCSVDLVGPLPPSRTGSRYLVAYRDALGATRTYHLRTPSDVHTTLSSWASVWHSNLRIKPSIKMDQAAYFYGGEYQRVLTTLGWHQLWSPPYAHALNGASERLNRTLLDMVRPMLYSAHLSSAFWPEAAAYAAWTLFRTVSSRSSSTSVSPYELLHGAPPDMAPAHQFGALVHFRDDRPANKLAPRSRQGLYMGVPTDTSFGTIKVFALDTGRTIETRDYSVFPGVTPGSKLRPVSQADAADIASGAGVWVTIPDASIESLIVVDAPIEPPAPSPPTQLGVGGHDSPTTVSDSTNSPPTSPTSPSSPPDSRSADDDQADDPGTGSQPSSSDDDDDGNAHDDENAQDHDQADSSPSPSPPTPPATPPPQQQTAAPPTRAAHPRAAKGVPFALHLSHPMPTNVSATRSSTKTYEQPGWRSIDTTAKARHGGNVAGADDLTAAALPDTIDATTTALDHAADGQPDPAVAMRAVREEAEPTDNLTFSARHDDLPCPTTWSDYTALPEHHKAKWRVALHAELASLKAMHTLKPVPIQYARQRTPRIIQTRWLFKLKPAVPPSTTPTPKARLVARGFQEPGINDRDDVYAPTVGQTSVRLLIIVAHSRGWATVHIDFSTAFLNTIIHAHERLFVYPPPGLDMPGWAMQLFGGLYGLKSSPLRWWLVVSDLLTAYGLTQHPSDPCLFHSATLICVIFVDDIKAAGSGDAPQQLLNYLRASYKVTAKTAGEYLSINFDSSADNTVSANSARYARDMISDLNMAGAFPTTCPLPAKTTLLKTTAPSECLDKDDTDYYRTAVGKMGYLTNTMPILCFPFSELSSHLLAPSPEHLEALRHVLCYINGHADKGYTVHRDDLPLRVTGYGDSNYATNPDSRKSVSGKFVFVGRTPYAYGTSRQAVVATSSAEAELYALCDTCASVVEARVALAALGLLAPGPSRVYSDNDAAIQSVMNGGYQFARGLNKHHAVRLFKLRELVDTGIVDIQPINTDDNIADIFTKALPTPVIRRHLANMHAGTVVGLPDSTGAYPPPGRRPRR